GGIFILNFRADDLAEALGLELRPLALIAIGLPAESIFLKPVHEGESLKYYRKDGVHFVPKLTLEDILI
ncbi:MAG: nitroreductase, partial [Bacteroidales bacterium]|nr:nitroreductase [Bacteroidales bacterium]